MSSNAVGRPMEILLVEDSLTSARVTIGALKRGGVQHRLTWLTDGAEAIEFLDRRGKFARAPRPDLILLDLNLPRTDGREVLATIKSDERLGHIPVIVLTSSNAERDLQQAYRLHANCVLTKPSDVEQFFAMFELLERFWLQLVKLPPHASARVTERP